MVINFNDKDEKTTTLIQQQLQRLNPQKIEIKEKEENDIEKIKNGEKLFQQEMVINFNEKDEKTTTLIQQQLQQLNPQKVEIKEDNDIEKNKKNIKKRKSSKNSKKNNKKKLKVEPEIEEKKIEEKTLIIDYTKVNDFIITKFEKKNINELNINLLKNENFNEMFIFLKWIQKYNQNKEIYLKIASEELKTSINKKNKKQFVMVIQKENQIFIFHIKMIASKFFF
jgi:hypothetical protein